jgi:hypothetical protein
MAVSPDGLAQFVPAVEVAPSRRPGVCWSAAWRSLNQSLLVIALSRKPFSADQSVVLFDLIDLWRYFAKLWLLVVRQAFAICSPSAELYFLWSVAPVGLSHTFALPQS